MFFHRLDGYTKSIGYFRLGDFVNFVHDKNGLAARRKRRNSIYEQLKLSLGIIPARGCGCRAGYFRKFGV